MTNLPIPPKQSYKAFLWDYDSLLAYSDAECCYSLSAREIQILLAQVDPIAWKTRYKPTETTIDQNLLDKWQGNLARKLMSGCCPDDDTIGRFSETGEWEVSTDGGETWTPAPEDDPRNDYVGAPPLPGEPSDNKRCAAADNVENQFLAQRDYIISLLEAGTTLIALMAGILAFLAVIAGIGGATIGISVLLMGMATAMLSMTPESVEEQIDDDALEAFKCLVYCNMDNDGVLTYGAWLQLLVDIAEEFSDFPETFFYSTTNAWGYIGMTNAGTIGEATASDCDDCDCFETCADPSKFWLGTVTSFVENMDGTTTFTVESVPDDGGGGTSETIAWGQAEATTDCCQLLGYTIISGECAGTDGCYWRNCGETTMNSAVNFPSPNCLQSFALQQNLCLTTPFTVEFIIGACP